jgi:hypothetical protein
MAAFTHMSWGWLGWGLNWLAQAVLFHQSNYYSHSTTVADWGLPRGGPRAFSQRGMGMLASNSYRTPSGSGRPGGGYNGASAQGLARAPYISAYAGSRPVEAYNRGYQTPGTGYARPSQEAYNRTQSMAGRPQQYGRSSYGSSFYSRPGENYGGRQGTAYGGSMQPAYRAPAASVQRGDYGQRPSAGFMGRGYAGSSGKQAHSGGFHLFGGGGHAPKSYDGGGKSFKGHSGGGGHGGGHGGGRHHFL